MFDELQVTERRESVRKWKWWHFFTPEGGGVTEFIRKWSFDSRAEEGIFLASNGDSESERRVGVLRFSPHWPRFVGQ